MKLLKQCSIALLGIVILTYVIIKIYEEESLKEGIDYEKINMNRYVDWAITTPIMLLVLVFAFLYNNKKL